MSTPTVLTTCYFDIAVGQQQPQRVLIDLFAETPKTSENFRALCTGENNMKGSYKDSIFHRVIKEFMLQGGDITNGNGTGGFSIYGKNFPDENFKFKHDKAGILSMANAGPNTNGSQFFITTVATPHLNGKHCVFGAVRPASLAIVLAIERVTTDRQDKPLEDVKIVDCGELKAVFYSADLSDQVSTEL